MLEWIVTKGFQSVTDYDVRDLLLFLRVPQGLTEATLVNTPTMTRTNENTRKEQKANDVGIHT
jgi:hypothetical protein